MSQCRGEYSQRLPRYRAACDTMFDLGLHNFDTIVDLGAGWQGLDYCLRKDYSWFGRYIPIDSDYGPDINGWHLDREVEFVVALEILEHLHTPEWLVETVKPYVTKGIIVSTPNPEVVDVMAMDPTHTLEIHQADLEGLGFKVTPRPLYGGRYGQGNDSLFAIWTP